MKKIILLLVTLMLLAGCATQHRESVLTGQLEGLQVGDTIFLTTIILPGWNTERVDTFWVNTPDVFTIKKELDHTTFFMVTYAPKDAPRIDSPIIGEPLLVQPDVSIELEGTIHTIGALDKKGGFYNDSLVARLDSFTNAFYRAIIQTYDKRMKAYEANQTDSMDLFTQQLNDMEPSNEQRELENYIANEVNDSEYAAYLYLIRLYDVTCTQLEERFNRFTPEVKASYMGQQLSNMLRILKNIEPGNTPSEFTVRDMEGVQHSLSDYRGKYLLIYNWGMCPGTIWVHPQLLELYGTYHDKGFEVLSLTDYDFFATHESLKEVPEVQPLFNHPWPVVLTDAEENNFIKKDYYLSGVPLMMLISPDGVTMARGFGDIFTVVKDMLTEHLD